jgi:putative transcriptional regulator
MALSAWGLRVARVENRIRRLRFDAGEMTQKDLADRVGVTRQTVLAIENGKYAPSLELAFRIARAFDVPLDQVFTFHDD